MPNRFWYLSVLLPILPKKNIWDAYVIKQLPISNFYLDFVCDSCLGKKPIKQQSLLSMIKLYKVMQNNKKKNIHKTVRNNDFPLLAVESPTPIIFDLS